MNYEDTVNVVVGSISIRREYWDDLPFVFGYRLPALKCLISLI